MPNQRGQIFRKASVIESLPPQTPPMALPCPQGNAWTPKPAALQNLTATFQVPRLSLLEGCELGADREAAPEIPKFPQPRHRGRHRGQETWQAQGPRGLDHLSLE